MTAGDPRGIGAHQPTDEAPGPAAAIVADGSCDVDELLARVVRRQRDAGRRLCGLLMAPRGPSADCATQMLLTDLATGESYLVSQPRAAASSGCRADPHGFARASRVLRRALEEAPELVVINRFGGLEAVGQGFRAELLELMSCGLPLLTAVVPKHLAAWREFAGSAVELPPELSAIEAWIDSVAGAGMAAASGRASA
ncbi:MAG TPA: DUF2478 domain-containing protein [Rubrivivax sp.]|nr:DUF2478 domain-containing protein [Rubrivivax sp.]